MSPPLSVAVIAPGAMGSAIAARLRDRGAAVLTNLAGRSAASITRAAAAGMIDVPEARLIEADMILSIVPPGEAEGLLRRLLTHIAAADRKPPYIDANALNPASKRRLAFLVEGAGGAMVDGGIIGGPPVPGQPGPALYVAGPHAALALPLRDAGLDVRMVDGPIGAAAALKMSYAGINKGLVGLGAAMLLAADREGAAPALRAEMASSIPDTLARLERHVPQMLPKAYRWVAEMREIAGFLEGDPAAAMIFEGMARLFERIATDRTRGDAIGPVLERALASRDGG